MTPDKVNFSLKDGSELIIELIQINKSVRKQTDKQVWEKQFKGIRKQSFVNVKQLPNHKDRESLLKNMGHFPI